MRHRSVSPSRNSVTRNAGVPMPTSKMATTFGCDNAATARASCSKRCNRDWSDV
jgi:hypothetical protein